MATKPVTEPGYPVSEVPIPSESSDSVSFSSLSLTTEEGNEVEGDSKYVLDRDGHHRYLRLGRALLYLKEPLHEPVQSEITKFHSRLIGIIAGIRGKQKVGVKEDKILNDYLTKNCLNTVYESNKIYIKNVNIEKWESNPWEIGKAFMPAGQKEENKGPEDSDLMGILRLISACKHFDFWMEADNMCGHEKVQKVLKVRHSEAHSHSLCCTEEEMEYGFVLIKELMEHMKQKFESFAQDKNRSEVEKGIYRKAVEKTEDALDSVDKVKTDTDFDVMRELVAKDLSKSKAYELSDESQRKEIAKVQLRCETRRIFILLFNLYKNRSKEFKESLQKQKALQSFIIEANPDDVQFLLAALEEKEMFQAENMDALLQLIEPLQTDKDFRRIRRQMMERKKSLERISAIASATVYDVFILHCEVDRDKAISFQQHYLDQLQNLDPPAKTILYDEYVVSGTSHVSALDYVLKDCRLVFILCTKDFMKNNLSIFQAEILKYDDLQKNKGTRVIPVYLKEEDSNNPPLWIKVMNSICIWKEHAQTSLKNTLVNGRKKYLKSPP